MIQPRSSPVRRIVYVSVATLALLWAGQPDTHADDLFRTWQTSSHGSLRARFAGTSPSGVILESYPDRTRFIVPLDDLSSADRAYVRSQDRTISSFSKKPSGFFSRFGSRGTSSSRTSSSSSSSSSPRPLSGSSFGGSGHSTAVSRINGTPDFLQTWSGARLPLSGTQHCGPAAAANALVFLTQSGYPNLALEPGRTPSTSNQADLVRALGSAAFMKTNGNGTSPWNVVCGLEQYVRFRDYSIRDLEFQGWQPVPRRYRSRYKTPNVASAQRSLDKPRAVVLVNLGFYRKKGATYVRQDGHWVTAAGYRMPRTFLVYDPSPRTGSAKRLHEIHLEPLPNVTLGLAAWDKPLPASGYHRVANSYPAPPGNLTSIIDGFVIMELRRP